MAERRVGDVDGGSPPDAPSCVTIEQFDVVTDCQWSLAAANGDTLALVCSGDGCTTTATGRFAGASISYLPFLPLEESVRMNLFIRLPALNNQAFAITGVLAAQLTSVADPGCASGQRQILTFAGPLPHLGQTTGTYSLCG